MPLEIKPGPVKQAPSNHPGSVYLYQLDNQYHGNVRGANLWSGALSVNNRHDPKYLQRVVKLFLAAEDMLAALETAKNGLEWQRDNQPMHWDSSDDEALAQVEAAIAKATL